MASKYEELKSDFVYMRLNGDSLQTIAKKLNISRKTAERWNTLNEVKSEIERVKQERYKEVEQRYKITQNERIEIITKQLNEIDKALLNIDLSKLNASELLKYKQKYLVELRNEENFF